MRNDGFALCVHSDANDQCNMTLGGRLSVKVCVPIGIGWRVSIHLCAPTRNRCTALTRHWSTHRRVNHMRLELIDSRCA